MITDIKIWRDGNLISSFHGKSEITNNPVQGLIRDIEKMDSTCSKFNSTLVITVPIINENLVVDKVKKVFNDLKENLNI